MSRRLETARNVAIILLVALAVAVLPGGGNAATAVVTALSLAFLAAIGLFVVGLYRRSQFTLSALPDSRRALLYSAVGAIALMIAGADELLETTTGALVWIGVLVLSVLAIVMVVREAETYPT
jgi:hypothetical protein